MPRHDYYHIAAALATSLCRAYLTTASAFCTLALQQQYTQYCCISVQLHLLWRCGFLFSSQRCMAKFIVLTASPHFTVHVVFRSSCGICWRWCRNKSAHCCSTHNLLLWQTYGYVANVVATRHYYPARQRICTTCVQFVAFNTAMHHNHSRAGTVRENIEGK